MQNYESGGWATAGYLTTPGIGTIMADTGQLAAGIYDFTIMLYCFSVSAYTLLSHRNAANNADLKYQVIGTPSETTVSWPINSYKIAANERLVIRVVAAYTGNGQGSIIWVRRVS